MKNLVENCDIVVVGAGHAGCEAALAGARSGTEYDHVYCQCRQYCIDAM